MADEVQESGQEAPEAEATPTPQVSEVSGDSGPSRREAAGEDQLAKVTSMLEEMTERMENLERQQQSAKDKAIAAVRKDVSELMELKSRLEAVDGDWNVLADQVERENLAQKVNELETQISAGDRGGSWEQEWQLESQRILRNAAEEFGVEVTPEELRTGVLSQTFQTKGDAYAALNGIIIKKMRGETISPAAIATEGGNTPEPTGDVSDAVNKLNRLRQSGASKAEIEKAYQEVLAAG